MAVVSVLVATVAFASAFTLPGGYRSDGTPLLAGTYAFDVFILFAGVPDLDLSFRDRHMDIAHALILDSGRSLAAAFALVLYMVLFPVAPRTAICVCATLFVPLFYGHMDT